MFNKKVVNQNCDGYDNYDGEYHDDDGEYNADDDNEDVNDDDGGDDSVQDGKLLLWTVFC